MIIQSSEVNMTSSHEKSQSRTVTSQSLFNVSSLSESNDYPDSHFASGADRFQSLINQFTGSAIENKESQLEAADHSILVMTKEGLQFRTAQANQEANEQSLLTSIKLFKQLLAAISLQYTTSAATDLKAIDDIAGMANFPSKGATGVSQTDSSPQDMASNRGIIIKMSFKSTEHIEEYEKTQFSSAGSVTTDDGKNIAFNLSMTMERDYSYSSSAEFTQSVLFKDPIIINYPGSYAQLSDEKYAFDIDADGNEEMISYFNSGAMLALDKNNDNKINDGSELFGALSGNGFADLAAYDEDGNNYIDEADSIFNDLKLWTKTADNDSLTSLKSMEVGAIYLGAQETPFDLKGEDNQFNAKVKASSFYLTDAGEIGSLQQVDMVV